MKKKMIVNVKRYIPFFYFSECYVAVDIIFIRFGLLLIMTSEKLRMVRVCIAANCFSYI